MSGYLQLKGKNSIIGKLYHNKIVFEDSVKSLSFMSNGNYSFKDLKSRTESTKLSEIIASDLSHVDKAKCETCITTEHSIGKSEFEKLGEFKVTALSNSDSSTHCVGALAALINSLNPSSKINSQLAYEQVFREITRRTNETVGDKSFKHVSEIFKIKGLSKAQFIEFLHKAGLYKSVEEEWSEVKTSLELEGISHIELLKFKSAWREMCARLIADSSSIPLRKLKNDIANTLSKEENNINKLKLLGIVNHIYIFISDKSYGEYFTKCLIIYGLNES